MKLQVNYHELTTEHSIICIPCSQNSIFDFLFYFNHFTSKIMHQCSFLSEHCGDHKIIKKIAKSVGIPCYGWPPAASSQDQVVTTAASLWRCSSIIYRYQAQYALSCFHWEPWAQGHHAPLVELHQNRQHLPDEPPLGRRKPPIFWLSHAAR